MSAPSEVLQEITLDDLGVFTAYANLSVKAKFNDRTIVRAQKGCNIVKILNRRGDELMLNLNHPNEKIVNEYFEYIRVAKEYIDQVFPEHE